MHDFGQRPMFNISLTLFTIFFHAILLLSIPTNQGDSRHEHKFYINALEQPFSAWGILATLFWAVAFLSDAHDLKALWGQQPHAQDYCFAAFSGLECLINMYITWKCVRDPGVKSSETFQLSNKGLLIALDLLAQGRHG